MHVDAILVNARDALVVWVAWLLRRRRSNDIVSMKLYATFVSLAAQRERRASISGGRWCGTGASDSDRNRSHDQRPTEYVML